MTGINHNPSKGEILMPNAAVVSATSHNPAAKLFHQAARTAAKRLREASFCVHEFYKGRAHADHLLTEVTELKLSCNILVGYFAGSFSAKGMDDGNGQPLLDKTICQRLTEGILLLYSDTLVASFPETVAKAPDPVKAVLTYAPYLAVPPMRTLERWQKRYRKDLGRDLKAVLLQPLLALLAGYPLWKASQASESLWNAIGGDRRTDTRMKLCCQLNLRRMRILGSSRISLPRKAWRRVP
jgi:hypothetical protein